MDHQVQLKTDLLDPSWEGGCICSAHHLHPRETACCSGLLEPYCSAIAMAVPTELIASTMISPELTPGPGLQTVAPCTLSIPGHWAGPVTSEIE
jgi:hypothetical protein